MRLITCHVLWLFSLDLALANPGKEAEYDTLKYIQEEFSPTKDYYCFVNTNNKTDFIETQLKVLVISPNSQNFPLEDLFEPGHNQPPMYKGQSFPTIFSSLIKDSNQCMTLIQLPEMFDDNDIIETMFWLKERCFDRIILDLNLEELTKERLEIFLSFLRFFGSTYGEEVMESLGIIQKGDDDPLEAKKQLNQFVIRPKTLSNQGMKSPGKFFNFVSNSLDTINCANAPCLNYESVFLGGSLWLGHPGKFQVDDSMTSYEVKCYHNSIFLENIQLLIDGVVLVPSEKVSEEVGKNLNSTTFTVTNPKDNLGKISCRADYKDYGEMKIDSKYPIEIIYEPSMKSWSTWSPWSHCQGTSQVGMVHVYRQRSRSNSIGEEIEQQRRYCRCHDLEELPRPRIVLIGRTGVGKSSLANQLLGGKYAFKVGNVDKSETTSIKWRADHYLGKGRCITVFDTPGAKDTSGRDYKHTAEMQKVLKDEIKSVDLFLLLISGEDTRFDKSTQELLLWYEAVFTKEMWKHLTMETTFWKHNMASVADRKIVRDMDEVKRHSLWEANFHHPPFDVSNGTEIQSVFIDPVVWVFKDPCRADFKDRRPTLRELEKFKYWTDQFEKSFMNKPPFDCSTTCQAPATFFSGAPFLVHPKNGGEITYDFDGQQHENFLEWQFLKTPGVNAEENLKISIDGYPLPLERKTGSFNGLSYEFMFKSVAFKVMTVRLQLKPEMNLARFENYIKLENDKGQAETVHVKWRTEPVLSPWTQWSSCSISCQKENGESGVKTKTRSCKEGINNRRTCRGICKDCDPQTKIETSTATCPLNEQNQIRFCPVPMSFSDWGVWGSCSADCGPSVRLRTRTCSNGRHGGDQCEVNIIKDMEDCEKPECPKHCVLGDWQPWPECPKECVPEEAYFNNPIPTVKRTRAILEDAKFGGKCDFSVNEEKVCSNVRPCPVDGAWNDWGSWSACSAYCNDGSGVQERRRTCRAARHGGEECKGESKKTQKCNENVVCPCSYGEWESWGSCSLTCGAGGMQTRKRPKISAGNCYGQDEDWQSCYVTQCPIPIETSRGKDEVHFTFVLERCIKELKNRGYPAWESNIKKCLVKIDKPGGCFHGTSLVLTSDKEWKRLQELEVGELVQSWNSENQRLEFSPVIAFMHRDSELRAAFLKIFTENRQVLTLTPIHLIYASKDPNENGEKPIFAKDVTIDHFVWVQNESNDLVPSKVRKIELETKFGIIAPLTANGNIMVDGVLASCYAEADHSLAHNFVAPLRWSFATWPSKQKAEDGMHWYISGLYSLGKLIGAVQQK